MAYVNTGVKRSLRITITKTINSVPVVGYPRTYDGQISWGDARYKTLTDQQAQKLTDEEYDARLSALLLYIQSLEPGYNPATDNTNESQITDEEACIPPTKSETLTSTTTAPPTTTTTAAATTTTTPAATTTTTAAASTTTTEVATTTTTGASTTTTPSATTTTTPTGTTTTTAAETADFFVSSSGGDDGNTGTSELDAWATINKVNTSTFLPGQKIAFKSGDSWNETLTVPSSGTSGNLITFGSYGAGANPIIYGSDIVSGWTNHSGNIYYATLADTNVYQIFQDGTPLQSARYPNSGYFDITTLTSQTIFTSTEMGSQAANYYAGCTIVIRDNVWSLTTRTVTASSGQQLTINSAPTYTISTGMGYYLFGHLDFLTGAGQWYHDESTNRLYVWTTNGTAPSNFEIRYSKRANNIVISNKDYVKIENLQLLHANDHGLDMDTCDNNVIDNNTINYSTARCINIAGTSSTGNTITNNSIKGAVEYGIYFRGGSNTVNTNTVEEIMTNIGVYGTGYALYGAGIHLNVGTSNIIRYNTLRNIGYHGIDYFDAPSTTVEYNYIYNAVSVKDDSGAIYTFESAIGEDSDNSVIQYNIIDTVPGVNDGTTYNFKQAAGIYLDERASLQTVKYNTIIGVGCYGIYLHLNNQNCDVQHNTVFDCAVGHRIMKDTAGASNIMQNNIFYNKSDTPNRGDGANPYLAVFNPSDADSVSIDTNTYVDRHRSTPFQRSDTFASINFADWKTATGEDASSTFEGTTFVSGETEDIFYNETATQKTFYLNGATNVKDIDGVTITTSFTVAAWGSKIVSGNDLNLISETEDTTTTTV